MYLPPFPQLQQLVLPLCHRPTSLLFRSGPVFAELDDTLRQAFLDFLEERGVTPEFGAYLMELVNDKLEVEYINWLGRMESFISAK